MDASGAVVQGAKVTINGAIGTKSDSTNPDGQFLFPLLTPGFYTVKVEKGSFKTADVKGIEVVTGKTSNLRVSMVAGEATEVVTVESSGITVDPTSTATSANLTDNFYNAIPVARGVTGLFYAAPGVTSGGGTGTANPSISGGTGLENNYSADGVSINDGAFGGIGVYSRVYGSLSSGINLSFVKEVQVKTAGFEAQYGKSTGGIVQIVTKSGSNEFHGSIGGYFAPSSFEATRKFTDDFSQGTPNARFNLQGKIQHQSNYDADAEVGGYVPGFKNKLFFFGSFNPQWNTDEDQFAQYANPSDLGTAGLVGPTQTFLGNVNVPVRVYSYSAKGTWRLNDKHQFEASFFGDPTYGDQKPNGNLGPQTATTTTFDKLQYGTRNMVVRYNGALTPSWLLNASWTWGHNNLSDQPLDPSVDQIVDFTQRTPCGAPFFNPDCTATTNPLRGQFTRQGVGYFENTQGDNYGVNVDTSKTFRFLGEHNLAFGYRFDRSDYDGTKNRTGSNILIDPTTAASITADPSLQNLLETQGTNAQFQLRSSAGQCIENAAPGAGSEIYVPGLSQCSDGGVGTFLLQTRGEFGSRTFKTQSDYHTVFAQDSWSINKFVTVNAGLRWEQQRIAGVNTHYTFTDNWSPRVGVSIDPWGNRKTKIFANFGRYTEAIPLDIALRSLSNELDFPTTEWKPPTDGAGHVLENPDGTINLASLNSATDIQSFDSGFSAQSTTGFAPGTRSEYLDEYSVGLEHEFGNSGVIFTARYTDRRVKRIVEDTAALSPEAAQAGLTQNFLISNPSKNQDIFVNPVQVDFKSTPADFDPATGFYIGPTIGTCPAPVSGFPYGQPIDSNGNVSTNSAGNNAFCISNPAVAGLAGADGIADGFVDPVRIYKSMEFEVNKSFSKNWQLRANYRIAKLFGNYEGSFRNDNGQSDPNISSLFDFTQGDFNLLGQQFTPGVLNTDVRHLANGFVSYTFGNHYMKGLTMGTSVHYQTGIPINNLFAHPVYQNAGEIPFCADNTTNCTSARGSLGRTSNWGGVDFHADYPIRLTERTKIRLAADLFNITDQRTQFRVDEFAQRTVGVPNADFGKPTGTGPSAVNGNTDPAYQRPFYARFGVKFEF